MSERSATVLSCSNCGTLQWAPACEPAQSVISCATCGSLLERAWGRSLDRSLALSTATLLLLLPANVLTLLTASILGVTRQSVLASSAGEVWREGWPLLACVLAAFLVVCPLLRFGLLTAVLTALRLGRRPPWLGRAFRWSSSLSAWAMPDVFLLGLWIAYARLSASLQVSIGPGGLCLIGAGVFALFSRATLNEPEIWRLIRPDRRPDLTRPTLACEGCGALEPADSAGGACLRCGGELRTRKVDGTVRAMALTLAALILYVPANVYAMATLPIGGHPESYTVLQGVVDLFKVRLYALAALVFCASFAIPLLKLAAMTWCVWSVWRRSARSLVAKTRLYRIVEEIGRWSMVDPFTIACFVPVMQINAALYGRAGPAATAFTGVVVATLVAAKVFDPRALWDAAESRL